MSTRDPSASKATQLDDVLITSELSRRPNRPPDVEAETRALTAMANEMAASPNTILQRLVDIVLEVCQAGSAGVSILEPGEGSGVFRWHAIAGAFGSNIGGTMARDFSPCGTVVDRNTVLLFDRPARLFTELNMAHPPILEALLAPFHADGRPAGTVWAVTHTPQHKFDGEDARLLTSLSHFASAAYRLASSVREVRKRTAAFKRVNEALHESEARYRTLVEQVKDYAIFMTDPEGRPTSWNEGVRRVLGFDEAEFVGHDITPLIFTPEDQQSGVPQRELAEAARTGTASNDRWMMRKEGIRFWASGMTTALRDKKGELLGFTKVMRDQTERKQAEEALQKADRRKDEFLAILAHELRNPLAPLRNSLEILRVNDGDRKTVARMRATMEHQVSHLARLVDDLLEVSRITRGAIGLRKERVEIREALQSAVETSRPLIDAAGHQLRIWLPHRPLYIEADPVRVTQAIANLLNNAVKFTERAGEIELSAAREGEYVVVRVRDTGIGIAPEVLARVFDLFAQVDVSSARMQGGLGIGLTLAKHLIEMHGGSIEAKSAGLGHGSEFIVRLPLAADDRAEQLQVPDESAVLSSAHPPRRILIVDDNAEAADTLAELLSLYGHEVQAVHNGPAALETFATWRPHIMLLDIGMPGMDGYEVARRVRQQAGAEEVKLIALTGWGQEKDRKRAREAGFDHHLLKPLDLQGLGNVLK
jgi:PAS domain S-box-containing protein